MLAQTSGPIVHHPRGAGGDGVLRRRPPNMRSATGAKMAPRCQIDNWIEQLKRNLDGVR